MTLTNRDLKEIHEALRMIDRAKEEKRLPKFGDPGKACYNLAYTLRKVRDACDVFEEARRNMFFSLKAEQDKTIPTAGDLVGSNQTEFVKQQAALEATVVEVDVRPVTIKELGWDSGDFPIAACAILLGSVITSERCETFP